jgi:hypothetical protein
MRATQVTSALFLFIPSKNVIARFMRATQFFGEKNGSPAFAGDDELWLERKDVTWVARIRGP